MASDGRMCGFSKEQIDQKSLRAARLMQLGDGEVFMDRDGNFTTDRKAAVIVFTFGPKGMPDHGKTVYAVDISPKPPQLLPMPFLFERKPFISYVLGSSIFRNKPFNPS